MNLRIFSIFASFALVAAADESDRMPQFHKLSNGLRICAIPRSESRQVEVQTWFRVGSSYDPPTLPGLTDAVRVLLQDAFDRAEQSRPRVTARLETQRDAVMLLTPPVAIAESPETGPRNQGQVLAALRIVLLAHAESFRRPQHSKDAFQKFKPPHDDAVPRVESQLLDAMFPGHPYRFAPNSWGDRRNFSDKDVIAQHYDRWFAPTNATVFVVGPLEPERVFAIAKETLGAIEWRDTPQRAAFDPPPDEACFLPTDLKIDARLTYCWLTPGRNWLDNFAIDVLFEHLMRAPDGPLRKKLDAARLDDSKWARDDWKHAGIVALGASVGVPPETAQSRNDMARQFATIVAEELGNAAQTPLAVESLIWARKRVIQNLLLRRTTSSHRLRRMAEWEMLGGDILLFDWELPRVEHITAADVMMAATALSESRRVVRTSAIPDTAGWKRLATSLSTSKPVEMGNAAWLPIDRSGVDDGLFSWPEGVEPTPPDELWHNLKVRFRKCPDLEMVLIEVPPEVNPLGPCATIQHWSLKEDKWNRMLDDRGILAWQMQCDQRAGARGSWGLAARKEDFATAFEILLRQNKERNDPEKWEAPLSIHGDLDWPETLKIARRIAAECQ